MSGITVVSEHYTSDLLRRYPDKIFVFGDNLLRQGRGGQAIVRDETNSFGIVTKRKPSMELDAFFSDKIEELEAVSRDLERLFILSTTNEIVFPSGGIGTGLAKLKEFSPLIWNELNTQLLFYFGFKNPT